MVIQKETEGCLSYMDILRVSRRIPLIGLVFNYVIAIVSVRDFDH